MCIILGKLKGNEHFTTQDIKNAISNNGDGNSFTIFNEKMEFIEMYKTLDSKEFLEIYENEILKLPKNYTIIYHFRIATNGAICTENCHPFENKNNILWHNGIFSEFSSNKDICDSKQFLNKYIKDKNINFNKIEKQASTSNKIIVYNKASKEIYYSSNFIILDNGNIASNSSYSYNLDDFNNTYYLSKNYKDDIVLNTELDEIIDTTITELKKLKKIDDIDEKIEKIEDISNDLYKAIYYI